MLDSLRNFWNENKLVIGIVLITLLYRLFQIVAAMNSTTTITIIGG